MNPGILEMKHSNVTASSFTKVYKSNVMRTILEDIKNSSFENSILFIYGEHGTEKDYLIDIILRYINQPTIVEVSKNLNKKIILSKKQNLVYIVNYLEDFNASFLFDSEEYFKCAIFVSDVDYEELYRNGAIGFELYEILLKSRKFYIPPLRERKQDIIPLAMFFLQEISEFLKLSEKKLSKDAQDALLDFSWTGNTYQLKRCLTKAYILTRHQRITAKDLFGEYSDQLSIKNFLELKIGNLLKDFGNIENSNLYETVIQEVEKALFMLAINETGGNQVKAAKILGINRNTLNKKLKHYNLI
ncbi:MAG TPA: helix-turn-helix domain-containing protein [Thermodesulfovibrio thiophilus]|nr:helix-turn-helix domain-containing protein [Thermodesulfovibrio thiophilus]